MTAYKVSVFILTYNQDQFIAQAIESALMQKTNFPFELVIGEDNSEDKTLKVCQRFASSHPNRIKVLSTKENLGIARNFLRTYRECTGEYVAILDGDDYWIDAYKLQKQVDFLDSKQDFSIVFTGFKMLFPGGVTKEKVYSSIKSESNFEDLVLGNYIASVTVLFRNTQLPKNVEEWMTRFPYGDWPLYLFITRNGEKIRFLESPTAMYRKNIGVSEKMKKNVLTLTRVNIGILECMERDQSFLGQKHLIQASLKYHRKVLFAGMIKNEEFKGNLRKISEIMIKYPFSSIKILGYLINTGVKNQLCRK